LVLTLRYRPFDLNIRLEANNPFEGQRSSRLNTALALPKQSVLYYGRMDEAAKIREIERLLQVRCIPVIEKPTEQAFVCVYSSESLRDGFHCFSYLLPLDQKDRLLSHVAWDLRNDNFRPRVEYEESYADGEPQRRVFYMPYGNESDAQALVRTRYYWNNYPSEIEVAEEFRLFGNLYHDKTRQILLHSDTAGTEHTVVRIATSRLEVQLRFLVDFLRAKQMHLAMQFEGNYWSAHTLEELSLRAGQKESDGEVFRWWFSIGPHPSPDEYKVISRLLGKAIIPCPGELTYVDPYEDEDTTHPAFIVGIDPTGREVTDAWDESRGNENALTPVYFRRSVLAKYFAEPDRYEVADGDLRCSGFWSLRFDNDHPQHVMAWLKDLGQNLPPAEREHWRSYNIVPDGVPSHTFYNRNIRAWFSDPTMPDLRLKMLYPRLNKEWHKRYNWPLWNEPGPGDEYVLRQLHVSLDENQSEFDQQNGILAKVMVDFLNATRITTALKATDAPDGSLNRLETLLIENGFSDAGKRIEPLRVIQALRSGGAAHKKGENYISALKRGGIEGIALVDASMKVFQGAVDFVEWMLKEVLHIVDDGPPPLDS
jgi:hypothetical protein